MDYIEIQKSIAPEMLDLIKRRHSILQSISTWPPVGRRVLAETLGWASASFARNWMP